MSPAEMRSLADSYIDAFSRMDVDDMLAGLHPQIGFMNISAGVMNTSTGCVAKFNTLATRSLALFSERHQTIVSFEVRDSCAIAPIALRAVAGSDVPNGLKKGQVLNLSGRSEFEFRDGSIFKITDIR